MTRADRAPLLPEVGEADPLILSLCDRTGVMVEPWLAAGFRALIVDLQHQGVTTEGRLTKVGADVTKWLPPLDTYGMVFAFPPCTHLAQSGTRWMADKGLPALIDGLQTVEACRRICEWTGAPYMLENPVGQLSTYWRKPDFLFDPWEYAGWWPDEPDTYRKKTCLWVGAGFQLPQRRPMEPTQGSKMHLMAPSEDRADRRSVTPRGFAQAVFYANVHRFAEVVA